MQLDFNRSVQFLGRNGLFCMAGITVLRLGDQLHLHPITSRGSPGRARMEIPLEHADELAALIRRAAGERRTKEDHP